MERERASCINKFLVFDNRICWFTAALYHSLGMAVCVCVCIRCTRPATAPNDCYSWERKLRWFWIQYGADRDNSRLKFTFDSVCVCCICVCVRLCVKNRVRYGLSSTESSFGHRNSLPRTCEPMVNFRFLLVFVIWKMHNLFLNIRVFNFDFHFECCVFNDNRYFLDNEWDKLTSFVLAWINGIDVIS